MAPANELGTAIRAWRARVDPEAAGLPSGGDRRVPGLRREELAQLAGVSVDYLIRLEQGRAQNPSAPIVAALDRALRLDVGEQGMLYRLAGVANPPSEVMPRAIPRGVRLMLDRLADTPVAVFSAAWDLIEANHLWEGMFASPCTDEACDRNLAWQQFVAGLPAHEDADGTVVRDAAETDAFERELVSDLRRADERYPADPELCALTAALAEHSPRFSELWDRYEDAPRTSIRKTMRHRLLGEITFDCDVLSVDVSDLRIVLYTAEPGTPEGDALDTLRAHVRRKLSEQHPRGQTA